MKLEEASNDIQRLLITGEPYARNIGRAVSFMKDAADHSFIYWHPEKGTYGIRVEEPFKKEAFIALHKAGIGALTDQGNVDEKNGYICVHHPRTFNAFRNLNKYASWTDSAGKSALVGALLAGLGWGSYKYLMPDEDYEKTLSGRWQNFKDAFIPAALIGSIPGVAAGMSVWGKGGGDLSLWDSMTTPYDRLPSKSPKYSNTEIQDKMDTDKLMGKEGSLKKNANLASLIAPLDLSQTDVVHVDPFNRITWDAAQSGTLDHRNALLTSGLLNTTKQRTHSGIVSPFDIAGTLVNAGIGYATAGAIGKTLGAMGMMSSDNQKRLREMGTWGGLLQGVGNCIR